MDAREATEFVSAEQLPGTVGAYLATPAGFSPAKVVAWTAACFAVLLGAVAALAWLSGGVFDVALGCVRLFTTPDLSPYVVPAAIAAAACVAVYAVLTLGAALVGAVDYDLRSEAKHGALRMMIERARFGVERQTPLVALGLKCCAVPGTYGGVVEVRSRRYKFTDDDFRGFTAADFGGCDIIVRSGCLYVFGTPQAKERWLDKSRD